MSTVTVCGKVTFRVLGNRLFGLPPEGDAHRQPWDEVVGTADGGHPAAGLQSVVGPEVQLRDVCQEAPPWQPPFLLSEASNGRMGR